MIKLINDYMAEELLPEIANTIYIMWTIFTAIVFLVLFYAIISYIIFEIKNHRSSLIPDTYDDDDWPYDV